MVKIKIGTIVNKPPKNSNWTREI